MKQFDLFKKLVLVSLMFWATSLSAQVHPRAFGPHTLPGGTLSNSNWYADYVGARVVVTAPAPIAGPLACGSANIGTASGQWPNIVWPASPIVNVPVIMNLTDSFGTAAFPAGSMAGKIALIWRGPISSPVSFVLKALNAQNAGAVAVVIINEYAGAAPFDPGYTTGVGTVTIPVLMIGNLDGIMVSGMYHSSPAGTVKMTLSRWGLGNANDLGIVPKGGALYHNYATPAADIKASPSAAPFKMLDGAFVANFGTHKATHTKLKSTLSWTPNGGGTTVQHVDSVVFAGDFTGAGTTDTLGDSIMAMFPGSGGEYNLTSIVPGHYNINYKVSSDSIDQFTGDNQLDESFYLTDSLYSKGRYDFIAGKPISGGYNAFSTHDSINWMACYFIGRSNTYLNTVQYSVSNSKTTHPADLHGSNDIFVFTWVDGSNAHPNDSIVQGGELTLVSWTTHNFVSGVDTSTAVITQTSFKDQDGNVANIPLDSGKVYFIGIDLPAPFGTAIDTLFLGTDGVNNPYPRIFGRWWNGGERYLDYSNFVGNDKNDYTSTPNGNQPVLPFTQVSFINVIDSFNWNNVIGMIPSIAFTSTTHAPHISGVGVNGIVKPAIGISMYPNPASVEMNVAISLDQTAKVVTYKVMDGLGRTVSTETHNNVRNESFTLNTSALRAGNYYLLISADDKQSFRKFTVIK